MIDERHEELAALHALDLLEGAERTEFESRLKSDVALRDFVADLREVAATIALAAPTALPPTELKTRLLTTLAARSQANVISVPRARFQMLPWAIAACFALATVWVGKLYLTERAGNTSLVLQQQAADLALKSARNQLEAERIIARRESSDARGQLASLEQRLKSEADLAQLKIAALTSLAGNSAQALAVAVWNPAKQEGTFAVDKLPASAPGQNYELWIIGAQQGAKPVSAGVFNVAADGTARVGFKPTLAVPAIAKFAVSREKNDGATSHTTPGEVIMLSQ